MLNNNNQKTEETTAKHSIITMVVWFAIAVLPSIIFYSSGNMTETSSIKLNKEAVITSSAFTFTLTILILFAVIKLGKLNFRNALRITKTNVNVYLWAVLGMIALGILTDEISYLLNPYIKDAADKTILKELTFILKETDILSFLWLFFFITVLPSISEEFLLRGMIQKGFENSYGGLIAIVLSSLFFGIIHMDLLQGGIAVVLGSYLGYVAYITRSIFPVIVCHFINNGISAFFAKFTSFDFDYIINEGYPIWLVGFSILIFMLSIKKIKENRPK